MSKAPGFERTEVAPTIPEEIRVRLHKRFPKQPRWFPPAPVPSPWELIRRVLAKGHADGLDDVQMAGAVYAALTSHGLMMEGRA